MKPTWLNSGLRVCKSSYSWGMVVKKRRRPRNNLGQCVHPEGHPPVWRGFWEGRFSLKPSRGWVHFRAGFEALVEARKPQVGSDQLEYPGGERKESWTQGSRASEFSMHDQPKLAQSSLVFYSNCHLCHPSQEKPYINNHVHSSPSQPFLLRKMKGGGCQSNCI